MSNLKTAKHPKVRPFLEYFSQSLPKVQERKFTRLTWIFKKSSQLQCLLMSLKNRKNASLCSAMVGTFLAVSYSKTALEILNDLA